MEDEVNIENKPATTVSTDEWARVQISDILIAYIEKVNKSLEGRAKIRSAEMFEGKGEVVLHLSVEHQINEGEDHTSRIYSDSGYPTFDIDAE